MTQVLIGMAMGGLLGFWSGRARAEWGRARADARAAHANRRRYRTQ